MAIANIDKLDKLNTGRVKLNQAIDQANTIQGQLDTIVLESGTSDAETIQARGDEPLLYNRLDKVDTQLAEISTNVKLFGAVGDGITDDTQAVKDAILSMSDGGTLFFPNGSYLISETLTITDNIAISGVGFGSVIVKSPTLQNNIFMYLSNNTSMSNIKVDGNYRNMDSGINDVTLGNLIMPNGDNIKIHDVHLYDSDASLIASRYCRNVIISDVILDEFQDHAVYFSSDCRDVKVDNFIAKSTSGGDGLKVRNGGHNIWFTNGYLKCQRHFIVIGSEANANDEVYIDNVNGECTKAFLILSSTDVTKINKLVRVSNCTVTNVGTEGYRAILNAFGIVSGSTNVLAISNCRLVGFNGFGGGGGGNANGSLMQIDNCYYKAKSNATGSTLDVNGFKEVDVKGSTFVGREDTLLQFITDIGQAFVKMQNNTVENYDTLFKCGSRTTFLTYKDVLVMGTTYKNVLRLVEASASDGEPKKNFYDYINVGTLPNPNFFSADYVGVLVTK